MARLERVRGSGLRVLERFDLSPSAGLNWVVGENGAGKTTFLEALYILSRGRSFRGKRYGPVVSDGAAGARIEAVVDEDGFEDVVSWKQERLGASVGEGISSGRAAFSVRLIGESANALLEGEPGMRRRFVDWNLFHVEPGFASLRSRFRRVSAQRNAWLRQGGLGAPVWDAFYADLATAIDDRRTRFILALGERFTDLLKRAGVLPELAARWHSGLREGESIAAAIERTRAGDIGRGYTFFGPSRGDLVLRKDGRVWVGSRGENKVAAAFLQVAADGVIRGAGGRAPVWLLDDLASELSPDNTNLVLRTVVEAGGQVFATALGERSMVKGDINAAVFHVKHGVVA